MEMTPPNLSVTDLGVIVGAVAYGIKWAWGKSKNGNGYPRAYKDRQAFLSDVETVANRLEAKLDERIRINHEFRDKMQEHISNIKSDIRLILQRVGQIESKVNEN